jgi:hypothetical protein
MPPDAPSRPDPTRPARSHIETGVLVAMLGALVLFVDDPGRPGLVGALGVTFIAGGVGFAIGPRTLSPAHKHRLLSIAGISGGLLLGAGVTYLAVGALAMSAMLLVALIGTIAALFTPSSDQA